MRIVAVSDLHGHLPDIPPCDLLVVAGDVCPDGIGRVTASLAPDLQARWFDENARPWLASAPARHRILIWGNHDWCGERCNFSDDAPGTVSSGRLVILNDQLVRIPQDGRTQAAGAAAHTTVWGTPWSNRFWDWAFMATPAQLAAAYAHIPAGIDILVSHQPPFGYGDVPYPDSDPLERLGSRELLSAIDRARPRLVVCGHIHGGYGRYEHHGIPILNVSVVDEAYRLVNAPTVIDLPPIASR
jgi:3',5'-cyclic AMP phosphodiesterase CpdA